MGAYVSMLDTLEETERNRTLKEVAKFYKEVVDNLINQKRFDTAVDVAEDYQKLTKRSDLLSYAKREREKNYRHHAREIQEGRTELASQNENTLLTELAVKKLYREEAPEEAMALLEKRRIENEEFRYRAFYALLKVQGEDEKANELRNLIIENDAYPTKLKEIMKKQP
jgi:hypothetical protein